MKTLLFIDDEPKFLEVFAKYYSKKGYQVFTAPSGEKGLETARWAVRELIKFGAITRRGRLKGETTIEDLLSGKYSALFAKAATRELVNEGLLIQETLKGLYEWAELGSEEWAGEAKEELDLIGKSLKALKATL